jgi:hypothetical protein
MAVKSMETAEEATTSMEMALGAWLWGHFPVPAGCSNRDFCPPKFVGGGGGATGLLLEKHRLI